MRQIALDTETTGLSTSDGHRIIEIAAIEIINRRVTDRHFHHYLNPQREIDPEAQAVHGITQDFLADKPSFSAVCAAFLDFVKGAELIIHNAKFDVGFINYELQLLGTNEGEIADYCQIIDSLTLARQRHPGQKNSLDALCKRYAVDNSKRHLHGGLIDAQLLAQVYLSMTGGQSSLFGDETHTTGASILAEPSHRLYIEKELFVLRATPEELSAHTAKLDEIHKVSKEGCVWLNEGCA